MDPNEENTSNKTARPPKRIVWTFPTGKSQTGTSESISSDIQSQDLINNSEDQSIELQEISTEATIANQSVKSNSVMSSAEALTKGNVDFKFIGPAIVQASINNPALMPELVLRPSEEAILKLQEKTPKPKKRKFKTAGPALLAKSTIDIALAHFPTDEQNALHENSSRKSKFNTIGPSIVEGTLNHPFAWLKDFKARDEIFPPLEKTHLNPTDSDLNEPIIEGKTTTDPKPGPSIIKKNQCLEPARKIMVKSAERNETNVASKLNEPSSVDANDSSASPKTKTAIHFTDSLQDGSLKNESGGNVLDEKNTPKERKVKTAGSAVVSTSTNHTSLANIPTEQNGLSEELHENTNNQSRNSKFNTIGPAIVQGTLSHPFAWLKDFKARDELSVPFKNKNLFDQSNAGSETKHDGQPRPSHGNGNPSIRKTVVKPVENTKISPKDNNQTKTKQKKLTSLSANSNESPSPKSATVINFTDPLQNVSLQNSCEGNSLDNIPEGSVNNTRNQTGMQGGPEHHPVAHGSRMSQMAHWNPDPEHPLVRCLENSGIPGLNESVKQDLHICTRFYWVAAFCIILSFCTIILMWGTGKFHEHPLKVDLVPTEFFTSDIPFPTTTSSLTKSYKQIELLQIEWARRRSSTLDFTTFHGTIWTDSELLGLMFGVDEVALAKTSFSTQLGITEFQLSTFHVAVQIAAKHRRITLRDDPHDPFFLEKMVPAMKMGMIKCKELILQCSWNGDYKNCLKMIRSTFSSNGISCSFNFVPDSVTRRNERVKSLFEEPVDEEERDAWEALNMDDYFESLFKKSTKFNNGTITLPLTQKVAGHSLGFTQLLYAREGEYSYSQLDADGFMINLSPLFGDTNIERYGFAVPYKHEAFVAITPEITLANPEIYKIDAIARGCYNSTEFHLDFYKYYSLENCLTEMLAKDILVICKCATLSGPKYAKTVICDYEQQLCAAKVEKDVYERNPSIVYKQCLPSCSNIVYKYDISYLAYSEKKPTRYAKFYRLDNDTVTSLIHVFMKDRTVIGKVRDVKYETFDKVGLLGGIFGFTSGIALINIAYLVLAIVICIFSIRKWRQRSAAKKLAVTAGMAIPKFRQRRSSC